MELVSDGPQKPWLGHQPFLAAGVLVAFRNPAAVADSVCEFVILTGKPARQCLWREHVRTRVPDSQGSMR